MSQERSVVEQPETQMQKLETCAFCAKRMQAQDIGEYEITWRYRGIREKTRGYYICSVCRNIEADRIQTKIEYTWLKLKARSERGCC
jgi:ribosomal protein L37AE/L43A